MARDPPRDDAGAPGAAGLRPADRGLHRLRSHGRLAARRPPGPDLRPAPAPAARRAAGRARRRRDGDDRRPVRAVVRAQPAGRPTLEHNVAAIRAQLERFLDFAPGPAQAVMVNNLDWLGKLSLIELPARHRQALHGARTCWPRTPSSSASSAGSRSPSSATCSSRRTTSRTSTGSDGVELQMGGADQWGNITAGLELIRRTGGGRRRAARPTASPTSCCCRRRAPSSARARAASPSGSTRTARRPYAFYQYWLNADDRDVRHVPALVHALGSRGDRGAGRRDRRRARRPGRPSGASRST